MLYTHQEYRSPTLEHVLLVVNDMSPRALELLSAFSDRLARLYSYYPSSSSTGKIDEPLVSSRPTSPVASTSSSTVSPSSSSSSFFGATTSTTATNMSMSSSSSSSLISSSSSSLVSSNSTSASAVEHDELALQVDIVHLNSNMSIAECQLAPHHTVRDLHVYLVPQSLRKSKRRQSVPPLSSKAPFALFWQLDVTPICFLPSQLDERCARFYMRHRFVLLLELNAHRNPELPLFATCSSPDEEWATVMVNLDPAAPPVCEHSEPPAFLTMRSAAGHRRTPSDIVILRAESPKPLAKSDSEPDLAAPGSLNRTATANDATHSGPLPRFQFAGTDAGEDSDDSGDEVEEEVDTVLHADVAAVRARFDISADEPLHRWVDCSLVTRFIPHRGASLSLSLSRAK